MLAQNFKSAADLDITEPQLNALRKTLVLLETGRLVYAKPGSPEESPSFSGQFNMNQWRAKNDCGTIACIGGTAELIGGVEFRSVSHNSRLNNLFWPHGARCSWDRITCAQASVALRSYLTTGDAKWAEAVA